MEMPVFVGELGRLLYVCALVRQDFVVENMV